MRAVRSGKMPTTSVRRRISRLRRSWGLLNQTCRQISFGNAANARMSGACAVQVGRDLGQLLAQGVEDAVELGADGVGVGLVIDAVQQRSHAAPRGLGRDRHQVGRVVKP
jgi:hypothetical protein